MPAGPARTIVKICGITRVEDARAAHAAGADWIGFVLKDTGPRLLDAERAGEIARAVPGMGVVAVMVAPEPEEALSLAMRAGATRVQLHRVDAARWPADFPLPATFSIPVTADGALTAPLPGPSHLVMLDTADAARAGGTGIPFPWETARVVAATRDVMLAGGLEAANVARAIARVRPFGVDASSRLETSPGVKDHERVRAFVAAVRAWKEGSDER